MWIFKVLARKNFPDTTFKTQPVTIAITPLQLGYEFLPVLNKSFTHLEAYKSFSLM